METSDYFNTPDYLDYLKLHCGVDNTEAKGRVAGSDLALAVIGLMEIQPKATVLEIGCGVGRILNLIQSEFAADVFGSDISRPAIDYLRFTVPELIGRVHCCPSDKLDFLPFSSVDHVVTWGVFELTDQRRTLVEISRVLRRGGRALLGSVKSRDYLADDEDSRAAHAAYVKKAIPISFTDVSGLEALIAFLGLRVVKRVVFDYKRDVTAGQYRVDQGGSCNFAEAMYIVEKMDETPLSRDVNVEPALVERFV